MTVARWPLPLQRRILDYASQKSQADRRGGSDTVSNFALDWHGSSDAAASAEQRLLVIHLWQATDDDLALGERLHLAILGIEVGRASRDRAG